MKFTLGELRRIIRESLQEADEEAPAQWQPLEDASFDVKIDDYLVQAEAGYPDDLGEGFRIFEAEGDEEPAEEPGDKAEPLPADKPDPKMDAGSFSREVARLVENFDNLFDVKGLVIRRALNYVGQKYGKEQAEAIKGVLETQFGLHLQDEEEPTAPPADRAGPNLAG